MQNLLELKRVIQQSANLINWNPTDTQLIAIAREIDALLIAHKRITKSALQRIVVKHCGTTRMLALDSIDNSDLNTLLAIARRVNK